MLPFLMSKYGAAVAAAVAVIGLLTVQQMRVLSRDAEIAKLKLELGQIKAESERYKGDVERLGTLLGKSEESRRKILDGITTAPKDPAKLREWIAKTMESAK